MLDMALVGFRYEGSIKVFKVDQGNTSPEILGNKIASRFAVQASWLISDNNKYTLFSNIYQPTEENENSYMFNSLPDRKKSIANADFNFFRFSNGSRRRGYFNGFVIPNDNLELDPFNIQKYKWAYIYNFKDKKLEFYGKDFPIVHELKSAIDMPYFASMNINTMAILNGMQKYYDVVQFLPRLHEQENVLEKSLTKLKPHKHTETRKKPRRRYY